jgi:hypothetical protein
MTLESPELICCWKSAAATKTGPAAWFKKSNVSQGWQYQMKTDAEHGCSPIQHIIAARQHH